MKNRVGVIIGWFLLLLLSACEKKTASSAHSIPLIMKFGNNNLLLNTVYATAVGDSVRFNEFKFYLSDIELLKSDGSSVALGNIYYYAVPNSLSSNTYQIPDGTYSGIRFNFGLTDAQNSLDSVTVTCPHPLCMDNGMWWGDNLKYTWIAINGGVKVNGSSEFNSLLYHIGTSAYRRTITINQTIQVSENKDSICTLVLDAEKILDGEYRLDMTSENICETTDLPHVAVKFANNIVNAFSISQ